MSADAAAGARAATGPYSDVIRERWRHPRFRGDLPGANRTAEDVNPLCGDRVRLMVHVDDGTVVAVRHVGDSCAICAASADVVAEMAEGRGIADAARIDVSEVLEALQADIRPTRLRCVTLPLGVLGQALA